MSTSVAAPTLSASGPYALDFLRIDMALDTYARNKSTSDFIKSIAETFDPLNRENTFVLGNKGPVLLQNISVFLEKYQAI